MTQTVEDLERSLKMAAKAVHIGKYETEYVVQSTTKNWELWVFTGKDAKRKYEVWRNVPFRTVKEVYKID